jgi:hypothetical protein
MFYFFFLFRINMNNIERMRIIFEKPGPFFEVVVVVVVVVVMMGSLVALGSGSLLLALPSIGYGLSTIPSESESGLVQDYFLSNH